MLGITREKPVGAEIESIEDVENWLRRLPQTHALACRLIYLSGKSQDEVAELLGFSRSHLSRMHNEALSWLDRRTSNADRGQRQAHGAREEPNEESVESRTHARPTVGSTLRTRVVPLRPPWCEAARWAWESRNWRIEPTTKFCCSSLSSG